MTVFLISLLVMLSAVAAMSIGRLLGRSGIRGSCGSLAGMDGGSTCAACSKPCSRRRGQGGDQAAPGNCKTVDGNAGGRS